MRRTFLCSTLFLISIFSIAAQIQDLSKYYPAVRPVRISILFSRDLIPDNQIEFFKNLENEMDEELIDRYYPLSYGSGFFISDEGHLITNYHVVDRNRAGINLHRIADIFLSKVEKEHGYLFSKIQFLKFTETVLDIFIEGEIILQVVLPDEREYSLELIDYDEDRDIALLKTEKPVDTEFLSFARSGDLELVHEVYAMGYPLPEVLRAYFADSDPTITSGIISARREKAIDSSLNRRIKTYQHTASINPGNSGGPLVTETGQVVGINSALLTGANNIYFAVSAEEITAWFEEIDMPDLLKYRVYLPGVAAGSEVRRFEVVFTSSPEDADVYVDNDLIGKTPLTTKLIGPREYDLRITKNGFIDVTDYIYVGEEEDLTYDFTLQTGGEIRFDKELPPTVRIMAEKGSETREFAYNDPIILPNGIWTLSFDGAVAGEHSQEVSIDSGDLILSAEPFLKTLHLQFLNLLPESKIVLQSSSEILSLDGNLLELPYGICELLIRTPSYRDNLITIIPDNSRITFEIPLDYRLTNAYLLKRGINRCLTVLIPGAVVTAASIILNLDAIAAPLAGSYEAYAALKYVTFSSFIAGGVSSAVGLIIALKTGKYQKLPDSPLETEYDFSTGGRRY